MLKPSVNANGIFVGADSVSNLKSVSSAGASGAGVPSCTSSEGETGYEKMSGYTNVSFAVLEKNGGEE